MTEAEYQDRVITAARARGWRVSHDPDSRRQEPGEPDLDLLWPGGGPCPGPCAALQIELKHGRGHRTAAQRRYANAAALAGLVVLEILCPDDLDQVEYALGLAPGTLTAAMTDAADVSPIGEAKPRRSPVASAEREARELGHGPLAAQRIAAALARGR